MSESSSALSNVVQWWQSHPASSSTTTTTTFARIQPKPSPLGGNGLFLTVSANPIDASSAVQPIAAIASDLLLTAANIHRYAQQHDGPLTKALDHLTPPDCQHAPSRLAILTFLLRSRALIGNTTLPNPWRPYLDALPTLADLHVPTQYEDQELALLHGTAMPRLVAAKRAKLVDKLEIILAAFDQAPHSPASKSAAPSAAAVVDMRKAVSLADLIWADAIFWSRVLETPAPTSSTASSSTPAAAFELAMIPILDFANHSFDNPTLCWDRDPATGNVHLSLVAPPAPSDELFLCYDPNKSNEQLLFTHGFVIPGNARGYISIDAMPELNMLAAQAPELAHRIQWAVNHLHVRPMVLVSASRCETDQAGIEWLESNLDATSLALVLLVAVDDSGAADAIQVASCSDASAANEERLAQTLAVLKARVGKSRDAVERACEFLQVVFSRVAQELDEITIGKVVVDGQDKNVVVVEIVGVGEDGERAVVEHEMARTRLDAVVGYKEQVRQVVMGVVKATMMGGLDGE